PVMFGGTGTDSHSVYQPEDPPEAFECGTINLPAIAGLYAALKYKNSNKIMLEKNLKNNFDYLYTALTENPMVKVFSHKNECGIVSFIINGFDAQTIADVLNEKYDIAVRAGLCCAPLINKHLGTLKSGVVRASLSAFNTVAEIKTFLSAIDNITYN
ncbi:MAG: aminotransferase class V-fold PLP-dependent enzyme, partial [Clostridia bacterium]|nr:aminotransferase class V-fold PLP-dependent enzyme [Clostridia bacterium]